MTSAATTESHSGSQSGGILFKLPKELRLQIYNMMLPPGKINLCSIRDHLKLARSPLHPSEDGYSPHPFEPFKREDSPLLTADDDIPRLVARDYIAMLASCRAIHEEAKPILYENTHFEIQCSGDAEVRCASLRLKRAVDYNPWVSWRRCSPEVDVFYHLQHARSISLHVLVDWLPLEEYDDPWMQQMPVEISGAHNLRKLDISFWCTGNAVSHAEFQHWTDHTMSLFAQIKCKCPVTAVMETSLGEKGFRSASYYAMLAALKGTDKTGEGYAKSLAEYSRRYYNQFQPDFTKRSLQLTAMSSELEEVQKDPCWTEFPTLKARAEELMDQTQKLSGSIASMQRLMDRLWARIQRTERERDLLLAGREAPLDSLSPSEIFNKRHIPKSNPPMQKPAVTVASQRK